MSMEIVEYVSEAGSKIELTPDLVKQYLVSGDADRVTDQELGMFMMMCKFQGLNPFLKEAYLIKYGTSAAQIVVGKETFLKRATRNPIYRGHTVGLSEDGKSAWAEVHKEGFEVPIRVEVALEEYLGKKGNGEVNSMWKKKPKTMLKKVALMQALREAFPEDLGGMYSKEEAESFVDITPEKQPSKTSSVKPAKQEPTDKEKKTKEKLNKQAEQLKGDVRDKLKDLLGKYCTGDIDKMKETLKEISIFGDPPNERFIENIDKESEKWNGKAYHNLKKKMIDEGMPEDCTFDPETCSNSSFGEDIASCGDNDCPLQGDKEF